MSCGAVVLPGGGMMMALCGCPTLTKVRPEAKSKRRAAENSGMRCCCWRIHAAPTAIVGLCIGDAFVGCGKRVVAVPLFVIKAVDDACEQMANGKFASLSFVSG